MDARLIERVIFNLMDNAIKYSPEGSEIRIRAHSEADEFYFSIADNGPGIPPESLPHVFERFYRVDKARSNDTGGTGLGLSIAKHIIQKHNGKISAESKPGQGATFSFTIPRP
ncbi:ATP-binding protein [Kamptonema cortianum]|nr:ATP-binding protein [Kamptonema cortianum]